MARRTSRGYRVFLSVCVGIILVTCIGVLLTVLFIREPAVRMAAATSGGSTMPPAIEPTTEAGRRDNFFTLLIAGTDSDGSRTDTILLTAMDTAAGTVSIMSIPRDTRAYMANGNVHKINAAHNKGIDRMLTEIAATVGFIPVRYCIIDYNVFKTVVNALGGVTVDVPQDMDYSDPTQNLEIHLKAGEQLLDGERALWFMRYRSGYRDADLGRIRAQQTLLKSLAKKAMGLQSLKLLPKLPAILSEVETDLTAGEMIWLAIKVLSFSAENVTMEILPGEVVGADYGADESKVLAVVNARYNPYTEPIGKLNIP
jgi:LCP family protein required for cell wall assembly